MSQRTMGSRHPFSTWVLLYMVNHTLSTIHRPESRPQLKAKFEQQLHCSLYSVYLLSVTTFSRRWSFEVLAPRELDYVLLRFAVAYVSCMWSVFDAVYSCYWKTWLIVAQEVRTTAKAHSVIRIATLNPPRCWNEKLHTQRVHVFTEMPERNYCTPLNQVQHTQLLKGMWLYKKRLYSTPLTKPFYAVCYGIRRNAFILWR